MKKRPSHQELKSLAHYLSKNQDNILEKWEAAMKRTNSEVPKLISLSQEAFRNHIPDFLERLSDDFLSKETSSKNIGKKHGAQRWEHGLDLQNTMKEWNQLHDVLLNQINAAQEELSLDISVLKEANAVLATHIHEGILYSILAYNKLQQQEAEAQLLDLKQALEDPGRKARDQNLRGTSHDLKGIMQDLIMGFYLLEDKEVNAETRELIDQMTVAAESLEQLLNDLLDLFRLESGREKLKLETFNVADILNTLCEGFQPLANTENLYLRCSGKDFLEIHSDRVKILRIARNLVLNGLKYTQTGGVEISWKQEADEYWLLKISDTGPGLSATHAASITTETDSGPADIPSEEGGATEVQSHGEGIGLLIVRHLCKLLDAVIDIETGENIGTTFRITFPIDLNKD